MEGGYTIEDTIQYAKIWEGSHDILKFRSKGKVDYVDSKGVEKSIQADNVVISAGRMPRQDEAMKFAGLAPQFTVIGDCRKAATLWNSIRTAYAAASHI